ncbi:zona pellucida sperm-binding protein 4-like, partial [Thalassophryne amazonica]|uniref:zona pellucida sperm-binding protein 4-like n=1 Tax=Thalassophryne amazonica TaxID=390379 RepID=UPI0014711620
SDQKQGTPQTQQVKKQESPQKTPTYPGGVKQSPFPSCDVDPSARIPCGGPYISRDECTAIDCCFVGEKCYYGKAVTVQCINDGQFVVVVSRDATLPNINLESVSLLHQGCTPVASNSQFVIFQFGVCECGTIIMEDDVSGIIYENRMRSLYDMQVGPSGVISRDSFFEYVILFKICTRLKCFFSSLLFQCHYHGVSVQTVIVAPVLIQDPVEPAAGAGPLRVDLRLANGQCFIKGCDEGEAAYSSFYTEENYPVMKFLRDPVYVEARILGKTDPKLVLTLDHCWATSGSNPHSLPQWDLLVDGCPYKYDSYKTRLIPVHVSSGVEFPTHHKRFMFAAFSFLEENDMYLNENIFIHCSTEVCVPGAGVSCETMCQRTKRDVTAVKQKADKKPVVSAGPLSIKFTNSESS